MAAVKKLLLDGKVAVITGAASNRGMEIARKFVDHGAKVILADISISPCQLLAGNLNKDRADPVAHAMQCDVKEPSTVADVVQKARDLYTKPLDIFYNNAGTNVVSSNIDLGSFRTNMVLHVESLIQNIEHVGGVMRSSGRGGCIICTGGTMRLLGDEVLPSAYSISKSAVIDVVRAKAAELGGDGVRVNAISPYIPAARIDKSALAQILPRASSDDLERVIKNYMISSPVTVEDVANAAVYLASEQSKGVNGQNIVLNGHNKFSIA